MSSMLTERHRRILERGVSGGAIDQDLPMYLEGSGANNNARELRRMFDRMLMGWDVRTSGGLATSGTGNGGVARHFGVATSGDLCVTERGAGANMSVDVGVGGCMVGGTENAEQGSYYVHNATAVVNVAISASDATNPRIDIIGVQIRDSEYSGANDDARIVVVTGTPAGVPAEPTLPANFLTLARVDVPALDTAIGNAQITDRRRRVTALGGTIVVATDATLPTVNLWNGMMAFVLSHSSFGNKPVLLARSGGAWVEAQMVGRVGCTLRRAAVQNIPSGVLTAYSFDTEDYDSDGFIAVPATTVTIPTGLGGIYAIAGKNDSGNNGANRVLKIVTSGAGDYTMCDLQNLATVPNNYGFGITVLLAAGTTVQLQGYQSTGAGQNHTARLDVYRVSP